MLLKLINHVALITIISYLLTRTKLYSEIVAKKKITLKSKLLLTIVLGGFSIYGSLHGIVYNTAIANVRDLGPAIGGLIAGPFVGISAGLIGAIYRFSMGGITQYSCSLATILIGTIAGLIYKFNKNKIVSLPAAVIIAVLLQIFHMVVVLLFGFFQNSLSEIWGIVLKVVLPMAIANGLGMATFMFISLNLIKERKTQAEKEIIDRDLEIAHDIQMGIVPKIFPPFPKRSEFDLHAIIDPAKQVGGDLYDFFFIDENKLCLVIGDVSGKGVPASLFMAVTKTLVKAHTRLDRSPALILNDVNNELCEENASAMFATLFLAILDTNNGNFTYCNAGHNNPYLVKAEGSFIKLPNTKGMALGVLENAEYTTNEHHLKENDTLFLYTDGINEAMNNAGSQFSYKRIEALFSSFEKLSASEIIEYILKEIENFAQEAPQSDDMTMVILKYQKKI